MQIKYKTGTLQYLIGNTMYSGLLKLKKKNRCN